MGGNKNGELKRAKTNRILFSIWFRFSSNEAQSAGFALQ